MRGSAVAITLRLEPISGGRNSIICRNRIRAAHSPSPARHGLRLCGLFCLGIPDTSAIAFGNADKYFRESVYDAYINDDWRISPEFTLNAGMRWEYGAPITELYGRLVNLDISPDFAAVAPVVANDPIGPLTGQRYPSSLVRPDKRGIEPRVGIAWRPIPGSSMVVRAGYGIYYDTSVYQTIALQMAQQPPLSKTLSVQNSAADPLTLANGFHVLSGDHRQHFRASIRISASDMRRTGKLRYSATCPARSQLTATYLGIKGTDGPQEFLPDTYPIGAVNPCPACPAGFVYLDFQRQFHAAKLAQFNYGAGCITALPGPYSTLTQNPSTTTRCWADRAPAPPVRIVPTPHRPGLRRYPQTPRTWRSRRTGWT